MKLREDRDRRRNRKACAALFDPLRLNWLERAIMTTTYAEQYRIDLVKAIHMIDTDRVQRAIDWCERARDDGKHIFVCANGGSASTASHFASK